MDMLVKLYALESPNTGLSKMTQQGIDIRRGMAHESVVVGESVRRNFVKEGRAWYGEVTTAFARTPCSCFIATKDAVVLGFACYDVTAKGFFGPTGVAPEVRQQGIGTALLLASLHAMREEGYGYAIIGGVGNEVSAYYRHLVGAVEIPGSTPGIYPATALI